MYSWCRLKQGNDRWIARYVALKKEIYAMENATKNDWIEAAKEAYMKEHGPHALAMEVVEEEEEEDEDGDEGEDGGHGEDDESNGNESKTGGSGSDRNEGEDNSSESDENENE